MKTYLNNYLAFMKENKNTIVLLKLVILIIINLWLLVIFWKILLMSDNAIITNNNQALAKASMVLQPVLSLLGIDILTPNVLKMLIITIFIIIANLSVLYFSQMAVVVLLSLLARYSYKSYTNYLINKENIDYMGFKNELTNTQPIVLEKTIEVSHTVSSGWGIWIALGLSVLLVGAFVIYIRNDLSNNIIATNESIINLSNNVRDINTHTNERITRSAAQIDYNNNYTTKLCGTVKEKVDLVDQKVENLSSTVQNVGEKLTRVAELNNKNTLELSKQSLNLSRQASEALTEIADSTTVVEATTVGLAHIWEIVKTFSTRIDVLEAKANIQTPRSSMHLKIPNINSKNNDDI